MSTDGSGWTVVAYASVVNTPYQVEDKYGRFTERIHPGSFHQTIARGCDTVLRVNHAGIALGRTTSGTLQLIEDPRGLRYQATLDPSSPDAQSLRSAVSRGDMTQSSFQFTVTKETWNSSYDQRDIYGIDLNGGDVGPVNYGASSATGNPGNAATLRAKLSSADQNDLSDSDFAFIQPGGKKDRTGKTVPRSYRHFPIHDAAHVRNALARAPQSPFGPKAMPKILAAAKKFGIDVAQANAAAPLPSSRSPLHSKARTRHTHSHPANGASGSWQTHTHAHDHHDDASHDHHDDGAVNADVSDDSTDPPSAEMLSLPNYEVEARIRILRLRAGPPAAPLSPLERWNRTLAQSRQNEADARRRIRRLQGKARR